MNAATTASPVATASNFANAARHKEKPGLFIITCNSPHSELDFYPDSRYDYISALNVVGGRVRFVFSGRLKGSLRSSDSTAPAAPGGGRFCA